MSVNAATFVFPFFFHPQTKQRVWIASLESKRDARTGRLVLWPNLDDDPALAQKFRYDYALVMQRRFREELPPQYDVHFAFLEPNGQEVERAVGSSPDKNGRTATPFKGVLVVPGNGNSFWYVRYPGTAIESTKGDSVEDAYNKCVERGLLQHAEKAPEPPTPPPTQAQQGPIHRIRPGSL
jgi:hypothetical protein